MGNTKSMTQLCDNFDGNKYDTQMTQVCHNYDTIHTFTAFNFISQSENLNALHHQWGSIRKIPLKVLFIVN